MATSAVRPMLELVKHHPMEFVCFLSWTERLREIPDDRLGDDREDTNCVFSASAYHAASATGSRAPDTQIEKEQILGVTSA